jgi:hypothetical protein
MFTTEAGHHQKRVYLDRDGRLIVPSSASILIEGSTRSNAHSGAGIINRNLGLSTSRTTEVSEGTISNRGVTIITSTAVGTLRLARPVKGVEKTLIWASTASKLVKVRVTPLPDGDVDETVKISGSFGISNAGKGVTCFYPSTGFLLSLKTVKYGLSAAATLIGYSSAIWVIKSLSGGDTTGIHFWTFATST